MLYFQVYTVAVILGNKLIHVQYISSFVLDLIVKAVVAAGAACSSQHI